MATLTDDDIVEIRAHVKTVSVLVRANDGLAYHRNNALRAYDDRVRLLAERDELIADRAKQSAQMKQATKRFKEIEEFAKGELALADFEESAKLGLKDLRRAASAREK